MGTPTDLDRFSETVEWIFDLDNTLYPRHSDLFSQIDQRMTAYVSRLTGLDFDPARKLQKDLYRQHGTTLRGLMHEYKIDPKHFLDDVHDIDYSELAPNEQLGDLITALPGRKHIFTNGDNRHAENTLNAIGIDGIFDEMFDIVAADYIPKPAKAPYDSFLKSHDIDPNQAAMFEDMPRNLEVPNALGMSTVLIVPARDSKFKAESWEHDNSDADFIHHVTDDINVFLGSVVTHLSS